MLTGGIDHQEGDIVVPIDGDLQGPPVIVPKFRGRSRGGFGVVHGMRKSRRFHSFRERTSAVSSYRLFNKRSGVEIAKQAGDFRLMDRCLVEAVKQLPENERFKRGLFASLGCMSNDIPHGRGTGAAGATRSCRSSLCNLAVAGLMSFSTLPLGVWGFVGKVMAARSFCFGTFVALPTPCLAADLPGDAALIATAPALGGVQWLSIRIFGAHPVRPFNEAENGAVSVVHST